MSTLPLSLALALVVFQSGTTAVWPRIQPISTSVPVNLKVDRIAIDVPLRDSAGRELYHFACRGGSTSYLGSLDGQWIAPLMCTLAEGTKPTEESLLSEDDVAAWHSRGQFREEELVGDCAKYPEFGLHRSFRLRGFRLNVDVRDVVLDQQKAVASFVLDVSVAADPSARSAQAERPGFLNPRRMETGCKVVRRGSEPRICRDARTGSLIVCK